MRIDDSLSNFRTYNDGIVMINRSNVIPNTKNYNYLVKLTWALLAC